MTDETPEDDPGYDRQEILPVVRFRFGPETALPGFWFTARTPSWAGETAAIHVRVHEHTGNHLRYRLALGPLIEDLAHAITGWNLRQGGTAVRPTLDALRRLDTPMLREMLAAWADAIAITAEQLAAAAEHDQAEPAANVAEPDPERAELVALAIPQEPIAEQAPEPAAQPA
jgi:hypothetical protein